MTQEYLDQVQNRTKEKRYTFDVAFGSQVGQQGSLSECGYRMFTEPASGGVRKPCVLNMSFCSVESAPCNTL